MHDPAPEYGKPPVKNAWGITKVWPEGTPGAFPIHDEEHIVCKDITKWRETVHAPRLDYSDAEWEPFIKEAEKICKYLKPDALFHHDDWGSQTSTFISPDMFEEFILPSYKKIYGYYKSHGVELIVHHSDSYAATLVPYMIDMGIDIWQGTMSSNNIPELIQKYGDKITIMGGIDSASVDRPDWTPELVEKEVRRVCEENGTKFFIPCITQGLGISTFPGVYETASEVIDKISKEKF